MHVIVRRDDGRGTVVKENDGGGWSSNGVMRWLGRQMEMWLSDGESGQD
jgi:hypothetical protein